MPSIILPCGRALLLDEEDMACFGHRKWRSVRSKQRQERYYAYCTDGAPDQRYIHRLILNALPGQEVDHINGDGLDNRRKNLRVATRSQNNANRSLPSRSGFRGVEKIRARFRAHIRNDGKKLHLGIFDTPQEAARAYDRAAREQWKAFARLNFPADLETT